MGQVIAITSGKGGTGKTTVAINLAASLAMGRLRILLIDLDQQCSLTYGLKLYQQSRETGTVYDLLTNSKDIHDLITIRGETAPLSIIPASLSIADLEFKSKGNGWESMLKSGLQPVIDEYDFIILDCPATMGILLVNALIASDRVILPIQPEYYSLPGIKRTHGIVRNMKNSFGHEIEEVRILLNKYNLRRNSAKIIEEKIRTAFPNTFRTRIRDSASITNCPENGETIFENAPYSDCAREFKKLAIEVLADVKKS